MTLVHPECGRSVGVHSWIPQSSCFDEGAEVLTLKQNKNYSFVLPQEKNIYFVILKSLVFIIELHNTVSTYFVSAPLTYITTPLFKNFNSYCSNLFVIMNSTLLIIFHYKTFIQYIYRTAYMSIHICVSSQNSYKMDNGFMYPCCANLSLLIFKCVSF
jgi:hypothetical protein